MTVDAALVEQIQAAQNELDPRFSALRKATGALNQAAKLAAESDARARLSEAEERDLLLDAARRQLAETESAQEAAE